MALGLLRAVGEYGLHVDCNDYIDEQEGEPPVPRGAERCAANVCTLCTPMPQRN